MKGKTKITKSHLGVWGYYDNTSLCFCQVLKYHSHLINKHSKVISDIPVRHANRRLATAQHSRSMEVSRSSRDTETCKGTIKSKVCVALAGAAADYKALSIQCQAFVCFFDLLLTTGPPKICEGRACSPPLNTFPHINKPYRCRNAWGPALTLLLEFSRLIR